MKNALPLLVAGGAALLLMGGKKKKAASAPVEEEPMEADEEEVDEGEGPETEEGQEYGKVASGTRKDRRGSHPWRIAYEEDGYHAQLMGQGGRFAPMQEEIGIAATLKAAKEMLRDHFNQALLDAGYSEDDFKEDPVTSVSRARFTMA
jgi:hypothetical protein